MNDILNKEPMEEDYGIEKSLRPQFFSQRTIRNLY